MSIRASAVAGYFYTASPQELERQVGYFVSQGGRNPKLRPAEGVVAPHAGYDYSGKTAGVSYAAILKKLESLPKEIPNVTFAVAGPNHTGNGLALAFSPDDWATPLGIVPANRELLKYVLEKAPNAGIDGLAHAAEHSIEVQLPFIQHISRKAGKHARVVALCMGDQSLQASIGMATAFREGAKQYLANRPDEAVLYVASSDFTHFESAISARATDTEAAGLAAQVKYAELDEFVRKKRATICGHGPIAMLACIAAREGWEGQVLDYANSGEASGDFSRVVGYGSIAYYRK